MENYRKWEMQQCDHCASASVPQARRPSGAQPAVCMALNDLTVSPVTGRCENRRHQGRVRENEPPGGSPQFGLNGGKPEARFIRAGQLLGSWLDLHKHPRFSIGIRPQSQPRFLVAIQSCDRDFLAGLVAEVDLACVRKRAGGVSNSRLKARLKAASDS